MTSEAEQVPQIAFVLVSPQYEGNVGACARALKNNAFTDLRLVAAPPLGIEARKMAWKSLDLLFMARQCETLEEAIADANTVVGFTGRERRDSREVISLPEAAPALLEAGRNGQVALLFGREDRGLTAEEIAPCRFFVHIPAADERPVYNLSQAVLLAAYTLRQQMTRPSVAAAEPVDATSDLTAADRHYLLERIRAALEALGYREHADKGLLERIVTRGGLLLDRAGIDRSDHAMLLGALKRIESLTAREAPRGEA